MTVWSTSKTGIMSSQLESLKSNSAPTNMSTTLRVVDIIEGTTVDGPGFRTAIYFAGCRHCCSGCHNPSTWDFSAGRDMTVEEITEVIRRNGFNVTFSGGDPFYQHERLEPLIRVIKSMGLTLWCYTGFTYEALLSQPQTSKLLAMIDVLVDGPFISAQKNTDLIFRGSSNQRLIDTTKSSIDNIVLWESEF